MGEGAPGRGLAEVEDIAHGVPCKTCGERVWGPLKTGGGEDPYKCILLRGGGIPTKLEKSLQKARGRGPAWQGGEALLKVWGRNLLCRL